QSREGSKHTKIVVGTDHPSDRLSRHIRFGLRFYFLAASLHKLIKQASVTLRSLRLRDFALDVNELMSCHIP
ncbi:MAG TPA: hypothetical protein VFY78_06105, partial [Gammaproteobacteria bacterium]|nr:hypothetical protein [Gammaproteobacteria bacterium]